MRGPDTTRAKEGNITMPQKYHARKHFPVSPAATMATETSVQRQGRTRVYLENFGTYFTPNLEVVVQDATLGILPLRLLLLAWVVMDRQGLIPHTQKILGERLHVSRQAINKAMHVLVEKGLILQEGQRFSVNSRLASKKRLDDIPRQRRAEAPLLRKLLAQDKATFGG